MVFQAVKPLSVIAGAVVAQNRLVKVNTSGRVIQGAAGADECVGVSLAAAAADGDAIPIGLLDGGIIEIEAGAAVTNGDSITTDATGRAVTAVTANAIHGHALQAASAAGEFIKVLCLKGGDAVA